MHQIHEEDISSLMELSCHVIMAWKKIFFASTRKLNSAKIMKMKVVIALVEDFLLNGFREFPLLFKISANANYNLSFF